MRGSWCSGVLQVSFTYLHLCLSLIRECSCIVLILLMSTEHRCIHMCLWVRLERSWRVSVQVFACEAIDWICIFMPAAFRRAASTVQSRRCCSVCVHVCGPLVYWGAKVTIFFTQGYRNHLVVALINATKTTIQQTYSWCAPFTALFQQQTGQSACQEILLFSNQQFIWFICLPQGGKTTPIHPTLM